MSVFFVVVLLRIYALWMIVYNILNHLIKHNSDISQWVHFHVYDLWIWPRWMCSKSLLKKKLVSIIKIETENKCEKIYGQFNAKNKKSGVSL